jgi:tetratricopeptide (TPR) repeat protein
MKLFFTLFSSLLSILAFAQEFQLTDAERLREADRAINYYQFEKALLLMKPLPDSVDTELLQRRGYCYARLGNYQEAIQVYENIVTIDSTNANAINQLGQLYSRTGQFELAKGFYVTLLSIDTANSFYYKQYASVLAQTNDIVLSMAYYCKVIELNPRDIEAYLSLSNLLLDSEQFEAADSILTKALTVVPHPQLQLSLAKAQLGRKKYKTVLETINGFLLKNDTTATVARLLGISYFQEKRYQETISCMEYLLKSGAEADWIYYYLGASYHQLNQLDEAISFLQKAIEAGISDNIGTYYTQLASSHEEKKDFKKAIRYYKAAYENSKSDILLYQIARSYDVFYKDKSQAIAYYKRYLSSDDTIKVTREYSQQRVHQLTDFR